MFFFVTSKSDTEANGSKTDSTSCMKKMQKREEGKGSRFPGWEMTLGRAEEDCVSSRSSSCCPGYAPQCRDKGELERPGTSFFIVSVLNELCLGLPLGKHSNRTNRCDFSHLRSVHRPWTTFQNLFLLQRLDVPPVVPSPALDPDSLKEE